MIVAPSGIELALNDFSVNRHEENVHRGNHLPQFHLLHDPHNPLGVSQAREELHHVMVDSERGGYTAPLHLLNDLTDPPNIRLVTKTKKMNKREITSEQKLIDFKKRRRREKTEFHSSCVKFLEN